MRALLLLLLTLALWTANGAAGDAEERTAPVLLRSGGVQRLPIPADADADADVWDPTSDRSGAFAGSSEAVDATEDAETEPFELRATPALLVDAQDLVVSWCGVRKPTTKDFVGLSCGPKQHAMDFLFRANASAGPDAAPSGSARFPSLYMLRCNYTAEYVHYIAKSGGYEPLGELQVGMKDSFAAPRHGHIALADLPDEMAVMFNSGFGKMPQVKFGLSHDALDQRASGNSTTYSAADMCHAPANTTAQKLFRDPGFMHKVILSGLQPATRYFYQFGNDADGWSRVFSFRSRPAASVKTAKFIAYADMDVAAAPASEATALRAYQEVADGFDSFLLHFGDVSYARGRAYVWDQYFHLLEPFATRVPYMVSIGNHEYDYISGGEHDPSGAAGADGRMDFHPAWANYGSDSSGECSVPMFHRWHAPSNGNGIYWYSFNTGGVHVVQMSSEHDWRRGSKQYQWLENDLKRVDRRQTPWVVLTAHRMMYTTQMGEDADLKVSEHFRDELEGLLWQYKVNLVLVGHQHSYERSCAVRGGKCTRDGVGPVHIIVGSAGAGIETEGFSDKIGEWSVSHLNDWGYLRVASTETEMNVQFVLNRNGAVYDEVTLRPWA